MSARSSASIVVTRRSARPPLTGYRDDLESACRAAIRADIEALMANGSALVTRGRVVVDGLAVEYRPFLRPDGVINVGTYYLEK